MNQAQKYDFEPSSRTIEFVPLMIKRRTNEIKAEEAGATIEHNLIVANLIETLGTIFKRKCCLNTWDPPTEICASCTHVFPSDVYIENKNDGSYFLHDVVVVRGKVSRNGLFVKNPFVVFEVLSKSNDDEHIEDKLNSLRQFDSFQEFYTIDSMSLEVLSYRRIDEWRTLEFNKGGIHIESLAISVLFSSIFFKLGII